jgi:hypothetical protein
MVTMSTSLPVARAADVHRMYTDLIRLWVVSLPRIPVWNFIERGRHVTDGN